MDKLKAEMEKDAKETRHKLNVEEKIVKLEVVPHIGYHFRMTLKVEH